MKKQLISVLTLTGIGILGTRTLLINIYPTVLKSAVHAFTSM